MFTLSALHHLLYKFKIPIESKIVWILELFNWLCILFLLFFLQKYLLRIFGKFCPRCWGDYQEDYITIPVLKELTVCLGRQNKYLWKIGSQPYIIKAPVTGTEVKCNNLSKRWAIPVERDVTESILGWKNLKLDAK